MTEVTHKRRAIHNFYEIYYCYYCSVEKKNWGNQGVAAHWKNGMIRLGMTRNVETNVGNIFNGALSTLFYGRLKIEREL